jgi:glycosyltransferase involved in cell wall biosynthesis
LAARGDVVDVLTTTSRSPEDDWSLNSLPAGESQEGGVTIRRFRVDKRDRDAFDRANAYFLSQPATPRRATPLPPAHVEAFIHDNINSRDLVAHLATQGKGYDAVVFLPYLYGPVLAGLPVVRERAWLQPCLHHECYALVPHVAAMFHQAKGLLFNSDGELELALRLYGPGLREKSHVVGQWIDAPTLAAPNGRIGPFAPAQERYVLYLGRRDETKNVGLLIESYRLYRRHDYSTSLKLVLAGPGTTSYHDPAHGIFDLGLLTDAQRDALLAQCLALFQPSYNESFSRVVMEAWSMGRPVAVNAQCISTSLAVRRSGGGWTATTKGEWAELMAQVDRADAGSLPEVGEQGRVYYLMHATPDGVLDRYDEALWQLPGEPDRSDPDLRLVVQIPSRDLSDELVRRGMTLQAWAQDAGYECALTLSGEVSPPSNALLALHSPQPDDFEAAIDWPGGVALAYDGQRYGDVAGLAARLLPRTRLAFARSPDEAAALRKLSAPAIEIWPFQFSMRCWDVPSDPVLSNVLADGKANCLFVGPLTSESCCEQLVGACAFLLALEVDARLVLAGEVADTAYVASLRAMCEEYRLSDRVVFVDPSNAAALGAAFRHASIFWSMSEGFEPRVPLVDAMWHDVPLLAYSTPATAKLLGRAGLLFRNKSDLVSVAAAAKLLIRDKVLRGKVLGAQEARRNAFTLEPAAGARLMSSLLGRVAVAAG